MLHIFGHTNPDTDAICSAVVAADMYNRMGIEAKAFRLGAPNKETEFVFEKAKAEMPPLLDTIKDPIKVVLVDHNSPAQSHPALEKQTVQGFIDHHTIENLSTSIPTFMRFEAICSTCSILYLMYGENNITISDSIATLMICSILSDSLAFRSPTTTDKDKEIVAALAKQLGISDIQAYAKEMFDAKSNLEGISPQQLLNLDYKEFEVNGKTFAVGVMETTNPSFALDMKDELLAAMREQKKTNMLSAIYLSVVDIFEEQNTTLVSDEEDATIIKEAFGAETSDNIADLGARVSRKKQLAPELKEYFERN